jgi:hypothetical protein
MLIKTGDAERIINVVDPNDVEDEDNRKKVLSNLLEKNKFDKDVKDS